MIELLSPAGNVEKLYYAYAYGADAAYIGLKKFSLRVKADNFYEDEYKKVSELKKRFPGKKLHCALNISFHNRDIDNFLSNIDYFKSYPIDAFIVQDLGIVPILQKHFPNADLHVSTQASCINREAVKMYKSLGFKRVGLGREVSLKEIREIKDAVPDMELEAFCHGAMCIAYAGRCLMSAYMSGRSAQLGACSHSCRWDYELLANPENAKEFAASGNLVLQEKKRPGEYYPIFEGEDFTALLSSKDIRMVEHLKDMIDSGLDSLKIEGRMKSVYYVALVTRAYRKALDVIEGKITGEQAKPFIDELENVSHRESGTGFYYNAAEADKTVSGATDSRYILCAEIVKRLSKSEEESILQNAQKAKKDFELYMNSLHPEAKKARLKEFELHPDRMPVPVEKIDGRKMYEIKPLNMIKKEQTIEFVSPDIVSIKAAPKTWTMIDPETALERDWVCDGHKCVVYTDFDLQNGCLVRVEDPDYEPGVIRDGGR
mgnify:FL=1